MKIIKKKPTYQELLDFREIARSSYLELTLIERFKIFLAYSILGLFFIKFLFNKFYLLIENHKLIGFAIIRINKIRSLFVKIDNQNNGCGSFLLSYIEKDLKDKGYKQVYLKPTKSFRNFYLKRNYYQDKFYFYKDL